MIKSYTLDCGCYLEHKKREGHVASYELVSACSLHDALSLEPPLHELPPIPFLSVPQAGGPTISTLGELLGTSPMDERNRHDVDHTVCEPLPMVQTNSRFEAKVEARVAEAMEHLEHTQPIPRMPVVLPVSRQEFEALKSLVNNMAERLPPQER